MRNKSEKEMISSGEKSFWEGSSFLVWASLGFLWENGMDVDLWSELQTNLAFFSPPSYQLYQELPSPGAWA